MTMLRSEIVLAIIAIGLASFISTQETTQSHNQINHFLQPFNHPSNQDFSSPRARAKRMYAMCPPKFQRIGNECYYVSDYKESWLDSHFECKDRNSKLAEPLRYADKRLRKFLSNHDRTHDEKWIGGMYNWERNQWQWGYNGKRMEYQSFSQMKPGSSADLKFNCAVLNPDLKYRWSAKACMEKHYFICQHRMPYVSEKSRQKIYAKWNETYPNEMANEVEVYVSTNGKKVTRREFYRTVPKPINRINTPRVVQNDRRLVNKVNDVPAEPTRENNANRYENDVNPAYYGSNSQREQQRPKKNEKNVDIRRNKPMMFGGNVDLFKGDKPKRQRRPKTTSTESPVSPNDIPEMPLELDNNVERVHDSPNPERHHNHHNHHTHRTTTTLAPSTSPATTQAPIIITESPAQVEARKAIDVKKAKQKRLKEKLAKLSPEEVERFIEMKRKLAEARMQRDQSHP